MKRFLSLFLCLVMMVSTFTMFAHGSNDANAYALAQEELTLQLRERERTRQQLQERIRHEERVNPDILGEVFTSAIDDSLFTAYFDSETGRVSFYDADGQMKDWYRYVDGEEGFYELVAINTEATSEPIISRMTADRVNRNTAYIDIEAGCLLNMMSMGIEQRHISVKNLRKFFPSLKCLKNL